VEAAEGAQFHCPENWMCVRRLTQSPELGVLNFVFSLPKDVFEQLHCN
jgi:hypothetical protein